MQLKKKGRYSRDKSLEFIYFFKKYKYFFSKNSVINSVIFIYEYIFNEFITEFFYFKTFFLKVQYSESAYNRAASMLRLARCPKRTPD